jgi:glucose-1-phosphate thymidylyltransferase
MHARRHRVRVQVRDPSGSASSSSTRTARCRSPKSPDAALGLGGHRLYFYDQQAIEIAASLQPSPAASSRSRREPRLPRPAQPARAAPRPRLCWLDTGTHESLLEASQFVQTIQRRQGLKIACLEEIALELGWLTPSQVRARAAALARSEYGRYLADLVPPA